MSSAVNAVRAEVVSEPPRSRLSSSTTAGWVVLAAIIALVWGPRLLRSFWVDEAGTWWMVHEGPIAAIQKTWHWPGQSLLYSVIASFFCLQTGPLREFVLRIPSLVGVALACYFLYRLAEDAIGRGAGFITVVLFTLNPVIYHMGTEARPYGLALAAVAAASWNLYFWVKTRERQYLTGYLIASTLIIYLHYLFLGIFLVHGIYLAYVFAVERRVAKWQHITGVYAIIAILTLPLLPHLKLLLHEGRTLPFRSVRPEILELTMWILPSLVTFGLFVAALLIQWMYPDRVKQSVALSRSTVLFFGVWLLLIPTLFWVASKKTGTVIFVDRYMSSSLEALALLLAAAGYMFFGAWQGRIWAVLGVLLSTASPMAMLYAWHTGYEDLMPFMQIIRAESKTNPPPPVFFRSELPESTFNNWRAGLQGDSSHLYAPFMVYPMPNRLLPLPFHFTKEAKAYISAELDSELRNIPEVIFVTHEASWNRWVIKRMQEAGFVPTRKEKPNSFTVIVFQRPGAMGEPVTPAKNLSDNESEDQSQEANSVN